MAGPARAGTHAQEHRERLQRWELKLARLEVAPMVVHVHVDDERAPVLVLPLDEDFHVCSATHKVDKSLAVEGLQKRGHLRASRGRQGPNQRSRASEVGVRPRAPHIRRDGYRARNPKATGCQFYRNLGLFVQLSGRPPIEGSCPLARMWRACSASATSSRAAPAFHMGLSPAHFSASAHHSCK